MKKSILLLGLIALTAIGYKKEKFTGTQSFWYGESVSKALYDNGSDKLTLYVDGEALSTTDSDIYFTGKPDCKEGVFVYEEKMYRNETSSHKYKIVDEFDDIIWEGSFTTKESLCEAIELVW